MYVTVIYDPEKQKLSFTSSNETLIFPNFLIDKNGLCVATLNEND